MNRDCLVKIFSTIRFLARQGLALRGHGDDSERNFRQALILRGEDDPTLLDWMKRQGNTYTSADIQNEMLQIMALSIVREISSSIRKSPFFSVMADETADQSNKEQVVIVIRYADDDLIAQEEFIGLSVVDSIDAATLTAVIKDCLLRMNLPLHNCCGQCYDGASSMSGAKTGVAKQISDEESRAIYTHCYGHALNLAAGDSIKKSKIMCDALDACFEISKLLKYSPQCDALFQKLKSDISPETTGFRVLCPKGGPFELTVYRALLTTIKFLKNCLRYAAILRTQKSKPK